MPQGGWGAAAGLRLASRGAAGGTPRRNAGADWATGACVAADGCSERGTQRKESARSCSNSVLTPGHCKCTWRWWCQAHRTQSARRLQRIQPPARADRRPVVSASPDAKSVRVSFWLFARWYRPVMPLHLDSLGRATLSCSFGRFVK